jgi:hypothetical protein
MLDECLPEYKQEWVRMFLELSRSRSVDKSDAVEDAVNEIIVREVATEDAFFVNAIDTGMLPHEWLDRAIALLTGRALSPPVVAETTQEEEVPVEDTAITHAHTEKAIPHSTKRKPLSTTRRHKEAGSTVPKKKWLNVTRRHNVSK